MSNFFTILKYGVINSFAINKLRKKNDSSKFSVGKIILLIAVVALIMFSSFVYMLLFGDAFNQAGVPELVLSMGIFVCVVLSLFVTMTNATGYLFKSKDYDLLMSLPIKSNTIVFTKVMYLLIVNYLLFAFIYIPTLVVYAIFVTTNFMFWFLAILAFLLLPMLPVAVSSILAYFLSIIIPKFKYKNLLTIILSLAFIIVIMVLSFSSSMVEEDPTKFAESMKNILSKTGEWAYNGIRGDYLQYLYFVLISVVPFIVFSRFIGRFYLKANTRFSSTRSNRNYKMVEQNITSQNIALVKKELKRYFGSPMYVLNTIVGPLLSTIILVLLAISIDKTLAEMGITLNDIAFIPVILVALLVFMLGITATTASSVSIEGKQFWILKSSPLKPSQIFNGKILVNLTITIPFLIINTIISIIFFDFKIIDYAMVFIIPLVFTIFMSYMGLYANLLFPRFDYENDVKAVKQSLSVLITMGVGFLVSIVVIVLGYIAIDRTGNYLFGYLVGGLISLALMITSIMLVYKHGSKIYNKIVI